MSVLNTKEVVVYMKIKHILSVISASIICLSFLNCAYTNALSFGDVNSDNTIDSSDASVILSIYADYSTGKTPNQTQDELSVADVNSDNSVDSTDASTILEYYAHISTGGNGTLEEFVSPQYQSNTNTFVLHRISVELPKDFKYAYSSKDSQGDSRYLFASTDSKMIIEESITPTGFTDKEILNALYNASKDNDKYNNVQIIIANNREFIKVDYLSDNNTMLLYTFVANGRSYILGILYPSLDTNKEAMVIDILKSIITETQNIDIPCSKAFESLSTNEKQFLLDSIMMFSKNFTNATSISINQCCETTIDNKKTYIYDLSYVSSAGSDSRYTFVAYPETEQISKSYDSYNKTVSAYSITECNTELINKAIREYYTQFK